MYKNQLSIFTKIEGLGAASGLVDTDHKLYIIGDNSGYLNVYHKSTKQLNKVCILNDKTLVDLTQISKAQKPDFEAICKHKNLLFILGSGSTPNRNQQVIYRLDTQSVTIKDLSKTYQTLRQLAAISPENFNIEGAVFTGKEWFLFNRGNGIDGKNGIFCIETTDLSTMGKAVFNPVKLPHIGAVEASFTDAILLNNALFFTATCENTQSTYNDGEILGSFIGSINPKTYRLNFSYRIAGQHKFEGLTCLKNDKNRISFLLCEDADNDILSTVIYQLDLW